MLHQSNPKLASPVWVRLTYLSDANASTNMDTESEPTGEEFSLGTHLAVMSSPAALLSNQYAFFPEVSKEWRDAWGGRPRITLTTTSETSVSQLEWSFDSGLRFDLTTCTSIAEHCGAEVLRCALSNGCYMYPEACFKAAARGKLEMIQWAIKETWG